MLNHNRWIKTTQLPSFLLAGALVFMLAYFTLLSPSNLEEDFTGVRVVHPKDLLNFLKNEAEPFIAVGVPQKTNPNYALRNFDYYAIQDGVNQLKVSGKKSNVYQVEGIIHAKESIVTLSDGTVVMSKEALFNTGKNVIEFWGEVDTTFENGMVIHSNYMRAITRPILNVFIPETEPVSGQKKERKSRFNFNSYGLTFINSEPKDLRLTSHVFARLTGEKLTQVQSDRARVDFKTDTIYFTMREDRPFEKQFAFAHQGDLEIQSRWMEMNLNSDQKNTISAHDDVSIKDKTFFATCGKGVYFEKQNQLHLSEFPQVYQDADTVTGDYIIYNRDEDTIEVKQSNAINEHKQGSSKKAKSY